MIRRLPILALLLLTAAGSAPQPAADPPDLGPKPTVLSGIHGAIFASRFSNDGKFLALAGADGIFLLDSSGKLLHTIAIGSPVLSLAFSSDDVFIAGGADNGNIIVVTIAGGVLLRTIDASGYIVDHAPAVAGFLPDNQTLVGGGSVVGLWSASNGLLRRSFNLPTPQNRMALSPDGKTLLTGWTGGGNVALYDLDTGRPAPRQPQLVQEALGGNPLNPRGADIVRFTPDGKHFYAGGIHTGGLIFYNSADASQAGHLLFDHFACGALTANLGLIVWGTGAAPTATAPAVPFKDAVVVTATTSKKEVLRRSVSHPVGVVDISPDGAAMVAAPIDGPVLYWHTR